MDNDTVAHESCLVGAVYLSFGNESASHCADLGDAIYLAYFHLSCDNLLLHLVEHTFHGVVDIVYGIIDDRVGVDFNSLLVGELACRRRRTHLECHDDGV